ncbi:MAG: hypothetical protein KF681_03440 [Bdellovibrionaceae bacterium]|nr:hypothetical protein [Pseudobdellovibrionaceae bacterium]
MKKTESKEKLSVKPKRGDPHRRDLKGDDVPLWRSAHDEAIRQGKDFYIDPETGYHVFTELGLRKRPCCGSGCRHCPYKKR